MSTWPTSTAFLVPANAHAGLGDVFDERFASFQVDGIVTDDEDVTWKSIRKKDVRSRKNRSEK